MEAYLNENDKEMFYNYLDKASVYFEYGSGGSTYQAYIRDNIKKIYSVESDKEWHDKLRSIIKDDKKKIDYRYCEMYTKSKSYGYPGPNSTKDQWINYSDQIRKLDEKSRKSIDLVMIDGRFRTACCLKCFDIVNNDCLIAFDDFLADGREHHHVVLEYYDIIDKTEDKRMVVLKKKANIKTIPIDIIKKYENQSG